MATVYLHSASQWGVLTDLAASLGYCYRGRGTPSLLLRALAYGVLDIASSTGTPLVRIAGTIKPITVQFNLCKSDPEAVTLLREIAQREGYDNLNDFIRAIGDGVITIVQTSELRAQNVEFKV